jgi:hypothetical protein
LIRDQLVQALSLAEAAVVAKTSSSRWRRGTEAGSCLGWKNGRQIRIDGQILHELLALGPPPPTHGRAWPSVRERRARQKAAFEEAVRRAAAQAAEQ